MKKLGIAVDDLGPSQLNYFLIQEVNKLLETRSDLDVIVFYENIARPCVPPHFSTMQMTECWGYDGPVIATSFATAEHLIRFPSSPKKVYYIWDLEWLRHSRKHFNSFRAVYGHPSLLLIARSEDHSKVLGQAWNRQVGAVVEDFDMKRLLELTHAL